MYNLYIIYSIFHPAQCDPKRPQRCVDPAFGILEPLQLWVYVSPREQVGSVKGLELVCRSEALLRSDDWSTEVNVTLPLSTLNNGTLYAHVFFGPKGKSPLRHGDREFFSTATVPLTRYATPQSTAFNLISGTAGAASSDGRPVSHWIPKLATHSLAEDWRFDRTNIPADIWHMLRVTGNKVPMRYLPVLYVDRLKIMTKQLKPIVREEGVLPLAVSFAPVSIGQFRLWLIFANAMQHLRSLGFSDKEFDDIKGIFLDTNLWFFGLTVVVSVFHLLFDFLAFKNDIHFWRQRKTSVGLSTTTILWQCFSQTVVLLYLMDAGTSLLILIPAAIATVIEYWKVCKTFKISLQWNGWRPCVVRGETLQAERKSGSYDSEAMYYLSFLLCPLLLLGAGYQLLYVSYKSWYSWLIHSLVNGIYAFGFLFMLPQLFLNYKLKSVAHLPWRVFMYKAFNTFIDDVFAFIIVMPTSHRIAVFRDDLVFLVYLYQRWLYPVDKNRVNEYGESFAEDKEHKD